MSTSTTSGRPNELQVRTNLARLLRGLGVDHATEIPRLVGDHADRPPVDAGERGDHVACPARGDLEQVPAVHQGGDHAAHVVHLPLLARDDRVRGGVPGTSAGPAWDGASPAR